jgi:hypothetical protein
MPWAGKEHLSGGRIDNMDDFAGLVSVMDTFAGTVPDRDEVIEARRGKHPGAANAFKHSDDVAVHVHEPQVTLLVTSKVAGVDEERVGVEGLVRGEKGWIGDEAVPPFGHAPEPADCLRWRPGEDVEDDVGR